MMGSGFVELYGEEFVSDLEKAAARHGMTDEEVGFTEYLNRRLAELGTRARFAFVKRRKGSFDHELAGEPKRRERFEAYHEVCMTNWKRFLNERNNRNRRNRTHSTRRYGRI